MQDFFTEENRRFYYAPYDESENGTISYEEVYVLVKEGSEFSKQGTDLKIFEFNKNAEEGCFIDNRGKMVDSKTSAKISLEEDEELPTKASLTTNNSTQEGVVINESTLNEGALFSFRPPYSGVYHFNIWFYEKLTNTLIGPYSFEREITLKEGEDVIHNPYKKIEVSNLSPFEEGSYDFTNAQLKESPINSFKYSVSLPQSSKIYLPKLPKRLVTVSFKVDNEGGQENESPFLWIYNEDLISLYKEGQEGEEASYLDSFGIPFIFFSSSFKINIKDSAEYITNDNIFSEDSRFKQYNPFDKGSSLKYIATKKIKDALLHENTFMITVEPYEDKSVVTEDETGASLHIETVYNSENTKLIYNGLPEEDNSNFEMRLGNMGSIEKIFLKFENQSTKVFVSSDEGLRDKAANFRTQIENTKSLSSQKLTSFYEEKTAEKFERYKNRLFKDAFFYTYFVRSESGESDLRIFKVSPGETFDEIAEQEVVSLEDILLSSEFLRNYPIYDYDNGVLRWDKIKTGKPLDFGQITYFNGFPSIENNIEHFVFNVPNQGRTTETVWQIGGTQNLSSISDFVDKLNDIVLKPQSLPVSVKVTTGPIDNGEELSKPLILKMENRLIVLNGYETWIRHREEAIAFRDALNSFIENSEDPENVNLQDALESIEGYLNNFFIRNNIFDTYYPPYLELDSDNRQYNLFNGKSLSDYNGEKMSYLYEETKVRSFIFTYQESNGANDPLDELLKHLITPFASDVFTGDGATSSYTLSRDPSEGEITGIEVYVNDSLQTDNYSVSGTTLTMSENVSNGQTLKVFYLSSHRPKEIRIGSDPRFEKLGITTINELKSINENNINYFKSAIDSAEQIEYITLHTEEDGNIIDNKEGNFENYETYKGTEAFDRREILSTENFDDFAEMVEKEKLRTFTKGYETSLLLHMDGINGSTTFADASSASRTVSVEGGVSIKTDLSKKYGSSAYFDGTGYLYSSGLALGESDFTFETWVRIDSIDGKQCIFDTRNNGSDGVSLTIEPDGKALLLITNNNNSDTISVFSSVTLSNNAWYHIAAVRDNNTFKLFVNGKMDATASISKEFQGQGGQLRIGSENDNNSELTGYLDEFRLSIGTARFVNDFNPEIINDEDKRVTETTFYLTGITYQKKSIVTFSNTNVGGASVSIESSQKEIDEKLDNIKGIVIFLSQEEFSLTEKEISNFQKLKENSEDSDKCYSYFYKSRTPSQWPISIMRNEDTGNNLRRTDQKDILCRYILTDFSDLRNANDYFSLPIEEVKGWRKIHAIIACFDTAAEISNFSREIPYLTEFPMKYFSSSSTNSIVNITGKKAAPRARMSSQRRINCSNYEQRRMLMYLPTGENPYGAVKLITIAYSESEDLNEVIRQVQTGETRRQGVGTESRWVSIARARQNKGAKPLYFTIPSIFLDPSLSFSCNAHTSLIGEGSTRSGENYTYQRFVFREGETFEIPDENINIPIISNIKDSAELDSTRLKTAIKQELQGKTLEIFSEKNNKFFTDQSLYFKVLEFPFSGDEKDFTKDLKIQYLSQYSGKQSQGLNYEIQNDFFLDVPSDLVSNIDIGKYLSDPQEYSGEELDALNSDLRSSIEILVPYNPTFFAYETEGKQNYMSLKSFTHPKRFLDKNYIDSYIIKNVHESMRITIKQEE